MRRFSVVCLRVLALGLVLGSSGCGTQVTNLFIDQAIGVLSAIAAAGSAVLVQQIFGG